MATTHDMNTTTDTQHSDYVAKFVKEFINEQPVALVIFFVYLVIVILQDIVMPHFSGKLISAIQNNRPLLMPFLYILIVIVAIQILYTFNDWQDALLFPEMHNFIREKIVNHLLDSHSTNYAEVDIASVLMRAVRLPANLFTFMDHMRYYVLPYVIVYTLTIGYIMYYDIPLGLIVLAAVLIIYAVILYSPKTCEDISWKTEQKANIISRELEDTLDNLISVYSQNQQEYEKSRIGKYHTDFLRSLETTMMCVFKTKIAMFPVMAIFLSIYMYRCYVLVKKNKIDAGRFVALFLILTYVANSLWRMINQMRDTIPRWGRIRDGLTLFDSPNDISTEIEEKYTEVGSGNIDKRSGILLDNVFFKYPKAEKFILKGINLHIPESQKIAIIGRIGCGKSTLLKLIMKYYIPTQGKMYWHGIPYDDMTSDQMRAHVGYVHQNPSLFRRSIYDNVAYGLDPNIVTREKIRAILKHIQMDGIFDNVPKGLDGNVGRKGSNLSGGQKQIVWLLRIFFKQPDILILDEPTASVDDDTKIAIQNMLELVMHNKTVIVVTHDKFLLDFVDRIITLESGKVISDRATKSGSWWSQRKN